MNELDRLLAAPAAAAPPADFLTVVYGRARRLRRRRAGVASLVAGAMAVLVLTRGVGTTDSLDPAHVPTVSPTAQMSAPPRAGAVPSTAPGPSEQGDGSRTTAPQSVAPTRPKVASDLGPHLVIVAGRSDVLNDPTSEGSRCVSNPATVRTTYGPSDVAPPGWCWQYADPHVNPAGSEDDGFRWFPGMHVCRATGWGPGKIRLYQPLSLVIKSRNGDIVLDSQLRWPQWYPQDFFEQVITVGERDCVVMYFTWDGRDTRGNVVPADTYSFVLGIADPAFESWQPSDGSVDVCWCR